VAPEPAYEHVEVDSRAAWRAWLAANAATHTGIWLVTWKRKADPARHLPYEELVEEALCFGWIDGRAGRVDEARTKLLLTPRRRGSGWSRPNKIRIERLVAAGLMTPAGQAVIDAAVADGSWTKLDDIENLIEPDDLRAALDAEPAARAAWDGFPRSPKRAALEWLSTAKRPETRQKRLATIVTEAAAGRRAGPGA
jgi:uncharacterized protein YdeI (YjbR/CyaY-like superfamily)